MTIFHVSKAFEIKAEKYYGYLKIRGKYKAVFWKQAKILDFKKRIGCYIFARQIKGKKQGKITPLYIGKTESSFYGEIFTPHKLAHYNKNLREKGMRNGTPVIFFIWHVYNKKPNYSAINRLETELIQHARKKKFPISNIGKTVTKELEIKGVYDFMHRRRPQGKKASPEKPTAQFSKMMRFVA